MQIWPWWLNDPNAPIDAARSTSTSSITISAELPPSSRWARLRCCPASAPTARPARVEPVNAITRTSGWVTSASPTSWPPGSTLSRPGRQPGLLEDAGEGDAAGHGGARIGLEHDGVAERQGRGHGADGQDEREVERRDHTDHAHRAPGGTKLSRGRSVRSISPYGADASAAASRHSPVIIVQLEVALGLDAAGLADDPLAGSRRRAGRTGQPARRSTAARSEYGAAAHSRWASRRASRGPVDVVRGGQPEATELGTGGGLHDGVVAASAVSEAVDVDAAVPALGVEEIHAATLAPRVQSAPTGVPLNETPGCPGPHRTGRLVACG